MSAGVRQLKPDQSTSNNSIKHAASKEGEAGVFERKEVPLLS